MSFILDALKKSQQERDAAIDDEFQMDDGENGVGISRGRGKRGIILAAVGVFIAADVILASWYFELFPPFSSPEDGKTEIATAEPAEAETATPTATAELPEKKEAEPTPAVEPVPEKTDQPPPAPGEEPGAPGPAEEFPEPPVVEAPPPPEPASPPVPPRKPPVKPVIVTPAEPAPTKPTVEPVVVTPPEPAPEKPIIKAMVEAPPEQAPEKPTVEPVSKPVPQKPPVPPVEARVEPAVPTAPPPAPPPAPKITRKEPEPAPLAVAPPKPPVTPKRIAVPPPTKRQEARGFLERARGYEDDRLFDQAIEAYSRALERDAELTAAYLGRGWSYLEKGRTEKAVDDFTQVIERRPNDADGYFARAWTHERMGAIDEATADYGQVVRLRPTHVQARFSRGIMHFHRKRFDLAARDFTDVLGRGGGDLDRYSLLWRYLSRVRTGANGVDELMADVGKVDLLEWPGVIVSLFLGQVGPERVLSSARDIDPQRQREKRCVAYFFLGQLSLAYGDSADATAHFRKTVDTGVTGFRQYWAARQELRRLGAN